VSSTTAILMDKELTNGPTENNLQEIMSIMSFKVSVSSPGRMDECTVVNTSMTRKAGTGFLNGQMEESTREIGKMVNNMERVGTSMLRVKKDRELGKKVRE